MIFPVYNWLELVKVCRSNSDLALNNRKVLKSCPYGRR